ncbi:MAG TPA: bifunctional DNA primase/polymerase [Ktedonobacteraceae bacterium]|nr:bifunctional DNA primase/polymerase [Ktedonobacteraceae bacterium]
MPTTVFPIASFLALNTMSLANAARSYAKQGLPVFPLVPRDKMPRVPRGFYSATTDPEQIQGWWSRWPSANIGIATGKASGLWVLDVDPRNGGLGSLEALERHAKTWGAITSLSETLRQLTGGGGIHLLYAEPTLLSGINPPNGAFAGYQGIDLKKSGGYIVAAPSIHPSGMAYQWQHERLPAPFPQAVLDLWIEARQRAFARASDPAEPHLRARQAREFPQDRERDPEYWLHAALRHATPGRRHNYACFLAIQLVSIVGCSFDESAYWMREYVAQVPQMSSAPYELDDALRCLRYAWWKYRS